MQISPIGISNSYSANRKNPSFSSRFLIDVGGSVGENSLKALLIENKSNNTIFKMKDVVNTQGKRIYEGTQDFLQKLSKKMAACYKEGLAVNPKDSTVKEAVFFMPGSVYDNKLLYADNIRGANGVGMSDIDFNLIPKFLKENGVKIAKDLATAKVYFSVFGSPEDRKKTQEALSLLRKEIGAELRGRLHLKRIPSFSFEYDDTTEKAARVESIFQIIDKEKENGK